MEAKSETEILILEQNEENEDLTLTPSNKLFPTNFGMPFASSFMRQINWSLIATVLTVKGLLFFFAVQSYQLLTNKPIKSWYGWLEIWNQWDSYRHLRLAEFGYTNIGEARADLFGFPLHPWLVRLFSFVFQDYLLSGFIVAGIASVIAALLLHKLVQVDQSDSVARNSVWFMLIFPTSYFLHINYTESLFLAFTLGTFLAARRRNWVLAGVLGIFTCLTRINGLVILPVLLVEAFYQYRETRRWQWQWLWILIAPLGFVIHLLINKQVTGDAFAFMEIGKTNFHRTFDMPWNGIKNLYPIMWNSPAYAQMSGVQEMTYLLLGFISIFVCWRWFRLSFTVWIAGNWLLFTSVGFVIGVPRYTLTLFPIFIIFAKLAEKPGWFSVITVWSLLYLGLFASQFVQGRWAF